MLPELTPVVSMVLWAATASVALIVNLVHFEFFEPSVSFNICGLFVFLETFIPSVLWDLIARSEYLVEFMNFTN